MDTVRDFIDETGFPPTRAEIAAKLGFRLPLALILFIQTSLSVMTFLS